jgi:hypothetical protein
MSDLLPIQDGRRGQTLPDFAVGIAVFLLTLAFVSVFVPQLIVPFDDQARPVVAERIASDLGDDLLTDQQSPSELNESATRTFFDQSTDDALEEFGVASWRSLNVTLRNAPSTTPGSTVLCEGDGFWIDECDGSSEQFAVGQPVPQSDRSVATARQTLFAVDATGSEDSTTYVVLEVRVW